MPVYTNFILTWRLLNGFVIQTEKHAVFRYVGNVLQAKTNDVQELIALLGSYHFDGVSTVCDYYIEVVREVVKAFRLPCLFPAETDDDTRTSVVEFVLQALEVVGLIMALLKQYRGGILWLNLLKRISED